MVITCRTFDMSCTGVNVIVELVGEVEVVIQDDGNRSLRCLDQVILQDDRRGLHNGSSSSSGRGLFTRWTDLLRLPWDHLYLGGLT